MIKFFRKIRQKLLSENRFNKYLIYAIGEIVLVVMGILIALQINNWNEQYKKDKEEKVLLIGLINNLDQDIISFRGLKKRDSTYLVANKIVLSAFINDTIRKDTSLLVSNIFLGSFNSSFTPTQSVYNEMKFSGKLNYISTDSIRNKIQIYYDHIQALTNTLRKNEKLMHELSLDQRNFLDVNSYFQSIIPKYARFELDEFDNSFFYEPLKSSKVIEFANLITSKQALMGAIDRAYTIVLKQGIQLKQDLIEYLNTK